MATTATPNPFKKDWRQHACIQIVVRFLDGQVRRFYSRDIDFEKTQTWKYGNHGYWVNRWINNIQYESPEGWSGRVEEAAIFHSFDGNRGDKIAQWSKQKGGWQKLD